MFAKLTAAFTAFTALAILAVATPAPNSTPTAPAGGSSGSCSTGALQCCQSVESANSAAVAPILAALGVVLQDLSIPVGLSCSGITGVGVGGSDSCSANAVCCENNSFGGLISLGCLPASL
ncbi:hypothetical protein BN946_scf184913.g5 [Trametes cinnabarina]|uniref:Hydrophobin n=1 Tax=Pycnoporus cinnabarinus TaxID=5643 RepID=A0A060S1P5_PYCCI|nr:hypothetical protein BN946_scf184913.g5 [Trametes cinnabarina]